MGFSLPTLTKKGKAKLMLTLKCGDGWITFQSGKVTTTAESALHCKALAVVAKQGLTKADAAKVKAKVIVEVAKQWEVQA